MYKDLRELLVFIAKVAEVFSCLIVSHLNVSNIDTVHTICS
jgi:hypothetical protein